MTSHNSEQNSWLHLGKFMFFLSQNLYLSGKITVRFQPRGLLAKRQRMTEQCGQEK
jgi:hypothetical protein